VTDRLVPLRVYAEPTAAHIHRMRLEEAGVPAYVSLDGMDPMVAGPMPGGVTLRVREGDVERAKSLLPPEDIATSAFGGEVDPEELERQALEAGAATDAADAPTIDPSALPPERERPEVDSAASDDEPVATCPRCGSTDVAERRSMFARLFRRRRLACIDCGLDWEEGA